MPALFILFGHEARCKPVLKPPRADIPHGVLTDAMERLFPSLGDGPISFKHGCGSQSGSFGEMFKVFGQMLAPSHSVPRVISTGRRT